MQTMLEYRISCIKTDVGLRTSEESRRPKDAKEMLKKRFALLPKSHVTVNNVISADN